MIAPPPQPCPGLARSVPRVERAHGGVCALPLRFVPALVALLLATVALGGCSGSGEPGSGGSSRARRAPRELEEPVPDLAPAVFPAPPRLVAIGDVHGDVEALRSALRLAGAIGSEDDRWVGGDLWIVQTGDLLDRGDEEDEVLALVARLEREAPRAGGRLVALNGNHEIMNVQGDFRYVTPDGFADFASYARDDRGRGAAPRLPREMRGRAIAFAPGGRYARELAARSTVAVIGETLFVHGGLTARQAARGLDAINREVRAFLLGEAPLAPDPEREDGPFWYRGFAQGDDPRTCAELAEALARAGASRMVVGHTVQERGITAGCGGRVYRIDVGLSRHYGGPIEVLEIRGEAVRVLRGAR